MEIKYERELEKNREETAVSGELNGTFTKWKSVHVKLEQAVTAYERNVEKPFEEVQEILSIAEESMMRLIEKEQNLYSA